MGSPKRHAFEHATRWCRGRRLKCAWFYGKKTKSILKEHNFDPQGVSDAQCVITEQIAEPVYLEQQTVQKALGMSHLLLLQKHIATDWFFDKSPWFLGVIISGAYLSQSYRSKNLTMTYFRTGIRTIIGAEAFHYPVRHGKEWGHFAIIIRKTFT